MTGLRPPPRREAPSRIVLRFLVLVLLVLTVGVVIWSAVINQRIDLVEDTDLAALAQDTIREVDGTLLNITQDGLGSTPMVLLHDFDLAGGAIWEDLVDALGDEVSAVRVDLPGFGLSERIPTTENRHTVARMAELVSTAVEPRFREPVVFIGVGLGGKVAAEIAVTNPELVSALVLVDVDFYDRGGWRELAEELPWVGRAVTYTLESGGQFSADVWAPNCETGGWCPSPRLVAAKTLAGSIIGTTDSLQAHRRTPPSSFVPSKLPEISAPTMYVWSEEGDVPRDSVDRAVEVLPDPRLKTAAVWKVHLDDPAFLADAIWSVVSDA